MSVASSEPANARGDGQTHIDFSIEGDLAVLLRAERSGQGVSRTYTITLECADAAGNTSSANALVLVPHDQRT